MLRGSSSRWVYSARHVDIHVAKHAARVEAALERYCDRDGVRGGDFTKLREAQDIISRRQRGSFNYANPYSRPLWIDLFLDQLLGPRFQSVQFYKITILDRNWHTSERAWDINPSRIKRDVRNRLPGFNFILFIEVAFFRNVKDPTGRSQVIAPHIEGLIWGPRCSTRMRKIRRRFTGGLFGADPIHLRPVYDLAGAVRYAIKPPWRGYSVIRRTDGTFGHRPSDLTLAQTYRSFEYFKHFVYPDIAFGSGEGVEVLRAVRAAARRLALPVAPARHRAWGTPTTTYGPRYRTDTLHHPAARNVSRRPGRRVR